MILAAWTMAETSWHHNNRMSVKQVFVLATGTEPRQQVAFYGCQETCESLLDGLHGNQPLRLPVLVPLHELRTVHSWEREL